MEWRYSEDSERKETKGEVREVIGIEEQSKDIEILLT